MQEHCPPKLFANRQSLFAVHYSLLATRYLLPFYHSLPAIRHSPSFSDLPICRPHDLPISFCSAGASPSLSEHTLLTSLHPRATRYNNERQLKPFCEEAAVQPDRTMVERVFASGVTMWSLRVGRGRKGAPIKGRRIAPKLLQ